MLAVMSSFGVRWRLTRRAAIWRDIDARTNDIIATSPLHAHAQSLAGTLSYSHQRALEICIAVSTDPKVLLLDEPTAGMSREETHTVVEFMRRSAAGRTLLVVEHDMDVVFSLAERISVLAGGTIVATGTPEEIRTDARVQAAYLGVAPG
jgi:branched-chain amino acid transport system ATP-binding protein